ncbi:hypothetical protein SAMN05216376_10136 [Mameliella alba]|uniref:hypothetical protein n=1 Tax=Mameliella alba TaxID=561184 RepID=UPI00088B32D9|nr:hypothetical protein [Mameliella alba]PTR42120.1 hypothetical protein LX94_00036 [Mameliella alba]GGF55248.1 hypothetical protein GCM10011319_15650 [Mameliella alba]SDB99316.1 hypothetical protein SAMN05216376_10136 [Mameliella alba]
MNLPSFDIPALCALAITLAAPAQAETVQGAHVSLELNALEPVDGACRISFLIQNGHTNDIAQAVYEAVLFDTEGRVDRMTLFDFGDLPAARPRVRQFLVSGLACSDLGRLLINGAETCEADSADACTQDLDLRSRTDVEIIG